MSCCSTPTCSYYKIWAAWACGLTQLPLCTGKDTPCRCGHPAQRVQAVGTFGFRGEALSSLCALADVSVVTRCKEALLGQKLSYDHAGRLGQQSPTARAPGTTVTAKQLFHNLPVRHKVGSCCGGSDWAAAEHTTSLVGWGPLPSPLAPGSLSSSPFTVCLCGTGCAVVVEALTGRQQSIPPAWHAGVAWVPLQRRGHHLCYQAALQPPACEAH